MSTLYVPGDDEWQQWEQEARDALLLARERWALISAQLAPSSLPWWRRLLGQSAPSRPEGWLDSRARVFQLETLVERIARRELPAVYEFRALTGPTHG